MHKAFLELQLLLPEYSILWARFSLGMVRECIQVSVETGSGHGLDHVTREIKKARYGSTMTAAAAMFASLVTPTFQNNDFAYCKCMKSPALYFFCAYACNNFHLQLAQSHTHYCCRSSTTAVCQGIFTCSRLIACMKPLPPIQATFLCLQAYG